MSRSVGTFVAYRFLSSALPYLPVASLCLAARGLSWTAILELTAIYSVVSAGLMIPLSMAAQRLGARRTMVVGALSLAVGAALAAWSSHTEALIAAQFAFAIGAAADAGLDSAYLWSLLGDQPARYRRAELASTLAKVAGSIVGVISGAALLAWSPGAPFAAAAMIALAAAVMAFRLAEVAPAPTNASLVDATRALLAAAGAKRMLLIAVVTSAVARVMVGAAGPVLAEAGWSIAAASLATAFAALAATALAWLVSARHERSLAQTVLTAAPLMLIGIGMLVGSAHGMVAAIAVVVPPAVATLYAPVWRAHLAHNLPADAPRALVYAVDATLVRLAAAGLPLVASVGAGAPSGAMLGTALALACVVGGCALLAVVMRAPKRLRLGLLVVGGVVLAPQLALSEPVVAGPTWTDPSLDLCAQPITLDKSLGMGSTIKFKGKAGSHKVVVRPAQTAAAGNFIADVAAYELAQALDLATVPYACITTLPRQAFDGVAGAPINRMRDEVQWQADDTVAVSVVAWVDGVKDAGLETSRATWRKVIEGKLESTSLDLATREAADEGARLALWDFLIGNWDRWSGGNTFRLGREGAFVWLDNAAGFGRELARTRTARFRSVRKLVALPAEMSAQLVAVDAEALAARFAELGMSAARVRDFSARLALVQDHLATTTGTTVTTVAANP